MHAAKKTIDSVAVQWATTMAQHQIDNVLIRSEQFKNDPERKKRGVTYECIPCHYSARIAGQAFTDRPCGICDTVIQSGNTDVNVLCIPCAKKYSLCAHCGADIALRPHRILKLDPQ